jgi:hypothetical protein
MKLKLKGRWFGTVEEIEAESERVLDCLTKWISRNHSKNGGDGGMFVYMREGTTSKMMAVDIPYGGFYYVYSAKFENLDTLS